MKQLTRLFIPICLETLFYMLSGMVDTLMLSAVGDYAVGAVGTANSYIGIFIIMFSIISSGMVSVMTQNIGAGRPGVAYQARQLGLLFNAVAGVLMAVFLFSGAGAILRMVGIADALYEPALIYLKIVGGGCILNAVIPIFSSYLRAFGYTKQPLYATIVGNIANFVMNAVFLFVLHKGVAGVATATVISKILNLCIVLYFSHKLISAKNSTERIANKTVLGQIVKVGLPSACETALYNVAMMLVIRFLNQMDAEGLNVTARSYTSTISNFSYCVGAALAQANPEDVEAIVRPCGLGRSKAKDICACMKVLHEKYQDNVPDDFDALLALPGVGRKSANLIMGDVFGKPAIVTDTHCIRLVNRMGLVDGEKDPKKVEMALWKIIPPEEGSDLCHRLVYHGRDVCSARTKPHCDVCCLQDICKRCGV